jgi:NADP-dependent 3-hydroxy acid dehydrogenase YdfG
VRALTEGLRQELHALGSGIKVTAISPGYVQTEFAARFHKSEEAGAAVYARYPPLQAEDVVEAVLYALGTPAHAGVHDILMRPLAQPN